MDFRSQSYLHQIPSLPRSPHSGLSQDFFQAVPASITLAIYTRHSAGEALLWEEGKAPIAADSASEDGFTEFFSRRRFCFYVEERWGKTCESYPLNMDNYI